MATSTPWWSGQQNKVVAEDTRRHMGYEIPKSSILAPQEAIGAF